MKTLLTHRHATTNAHTHIHIHTPIDTSNPEWHTFTQLLTEGVPPTARENRKVQVLVYPTIISIIVISRSSIASQPASIIPGKRRESGDTATTPTTS